MTGPGSGVLISKRWVFTAMEMGCVRGEGVMDLKVQAIFFEN